MAITRPPKKTTPDPAVDQAAAERFISGAPDSARAATGPAAASVAASNVVKGNQVQISFALPGDLLMRVDAVAGSLSISRAAFIKQALTRAVMAEQS